MTAEDLLSELRAQGFELRPLPGGFLEVGPADWLTDGLRAAIRQHKASILAALTRPVEQQEFFQSQPAEVCDLCGDPACWLTPLGRWCLLIPLDKEKIRATKTMKPAKTQPVS